MPFNSSQQRTDTFAAPMPERSPLEPLSSYSIRLKKWRRDNAWRAGQMRAVEELDKKRTGTIPDVEPGK